MLPCKNNTEVNERSSWLHDPTYGPSCHVGVCVCVLRGEGVTFIVTYTCYPSALTGIHAMQSQKGSNVGG